MTQWYISPAFLICVLLVACQADKSPKNNPVTALQNEGYFVTNFSTDTALIDEEIAYANELYYTKPDSLMLLLHHAINSSLIIDYKQGAINAFSFLGNKYKDLGKYDSSLYCFQQALSYAAALSPDNGTTATLYASIGSIYLQRSKFDTASLYMYKALAYLEFGNMPHNNESTIKNAYEVYRGVGKLWLNVDNLENALPYLNKARMIASIDNTHGLTMDALLVKATVFAKQQRIDSAIKCYNTILQNRTSNIPTLVNANLNIAKMYLLDTLPQKAIPHLLKAHQLSKKNTYEQSILQINSALATAYAMEGDYTSSTKILKKVIEESKSMGLGADLINTQLNLAVNYRYLNDYKRAYYQVWKAMDLNDSLLQQKRRAINDLEFKYRNLEKDRLLAENQLSIAQQENRLQQQYIWLVVGGSGCLIVILCLVLLLRTKRHKTEMDRMKATMQGEEKERARLARELHDGTVSSLSAIRMNLSALPMQYPEMKGATPYLQGSLAQLDQSIAELRNTSHNLLPEILYNAGLAEAVRIYAANISSLGHPDIEFMMVGQLPQLNQDFQLTVYRIIQELINNIIKHANATHVLIQFQIMEDELNITIEDNGDGVPFFHLQPANGIGIQNLKNRVNSLKGTIEIASNKGTSVYLAFNLQPFTEHNIPTTHNNSRGLNKNSKLQ